MLITIFYVSRFALRVCDRSANTAQNSEVHPNATLAADGNKLAEALQMAENGDTSVLESLSAAAIDTTPAAVIGVFTIFGCL